jgi:hypothetical protein
LPDTKFSKSFFILILLNDCIQQEPVVHKDGIFPTNNADEISLTLEDLGACWKVNSMGNFEGEYIAIFQSTERRSTPEQPVEQILTGITVFPDIESAKIDYETKRKDVAQKGYKPINMNIGNEGDIIDSSIYHIDMETQE